MTEQTSHSYDYIVIGGGSAGCVAAGELSKDPSNHVLVLEAGERAEKYPETLAADQYKKALVNNHLMWERFAEPVKGLNGDRRMYQGSGRGVGGSGSVNGMVYTRGSAFDYDNWGLEGWRWSDVAPDFEALEATLGISRKEPTRFTEACIAGAEAAGFSRKEDLNDGTMSGYLGYEWMNMVGNDRRSSYVAFLRPALERDNVELHSNARVQRILFDPSRRATGVEYLHEGTLRRADVRGEIVLSAGALESPKVLMHSGIGPGDALGALGIDVVADLPVGQNLHDHPNVTVFFRGKQQTDCHWVQLYGFNRANHESSLATGEADTCYVFYTARSSFKQGAVRMAPMMLLPQWLYKLAPLRWSTRAMINTVFSTPPAQWAINRMWGIVVILGKPKSRGTLTLRSPNPDDRAIIDPGYLTDPEDLETMIRAVQLARKVAGTEPLASWGNKAMSVKPDDDRAAIEKFIRKYIMTTFHYAGTCRMGSNGDGVVDRALRVKGVDGLRVADASVVPWTPVSAMNAPSMLMGYRAAKLLAKGSR